MLHLEPLGTGRILPAFVVGYELSDEARNALERLEPAPDRLLILDQQAGGLGMSYPTVVGAVRPEVYRGRRDVVDQWVLDAHGSALRLADEVLFAPPLTGTLAEVGRAMGDDGPPGVFLLWENSD